jgi:suppressor of fused
MGLFDFLKKKPSKQEHDLDAAPPAHGWHAIEDAFAELYPGQTAKHWAHNGIMRMHDLRNPPENPFDGVTIYDGVTFWHYVSFGLSDLYAKESDDDWSGFGYEFTFRLAKGSEAEPPPWPINVMGSLGRAVFTGSAFAPGHSVDMMKPLDGPDSTSTITAVLLTKDPGLEQVRETPHGKLAFLLILGVEGSLRERALAEGTDKVLTEIRQTNPDLLTRF